jgi:hypothetical protein
MARRKENNFKTFLKSSNEDYAMALAEIDAGRKYNHWVRIYSGLEYPYDNYIQYYSTNIIYVSIFI